MVQTCSLTADYHGQTGTHVAIAQFQCPWVWECKVPFVIEHLDALCTGGSRLVPLLLEAWHTCQLPACPPARRFTLPCTLPTFVCGL
jgi:hypothetical protein